MPGKQLLEGEKTVSGIVSKLFSLEDRVAVVTGAGRGIGRELALTFAGAGAKVVVADIAFEAGRKVASQINASGSQAIALKTDVSSEEDVKSMVQTTVEHFGKIDVLVNNAARGGGPASPESLSLNDWNTVSKSDGCLSLLQRSRKGDDRPKKRINCQYGFCRRSRRESLQG